MKLTNKEIPRSNFGQDLLYSFGAFMKVCRIGRNDAENQVRNMANNGWKTSFKTTVSLSNDTEVSTDEAIDLERLARD